MFYFALIEFTRFRLNSLLATYGTSSNDKKKLPSRNVRTNNNETYPPHREREPPRSIKLKPQEYFLFVIAFLAISALVIYNVFMSYYNYYDSINEKLD